MNSFLSIWLLVTIILHGPTLYTKSDNTITTMALAATTNKVHKPIVMCRSKSNSTTSSTTLLSSTDSNNNKFVSVDEVTSSSSSSTSISSTSSKNSESSSTSLLLRDDEPYLYNLPTHLSLTYRSVPIWIQVLVSMTSIWLRSILIMTTSSSSSSLVLFWKGIQWKLLLQYPILYFTKLCQTKNIRSIIRLVIESGIFAWLIIKVIQEWYLPPSRITTDTLIQDHGLPSSLSKYQKLSLPSIQDNRNDNDKNDDNSIKHVEEQQQQLGIHYLQYDNPLQQQQQQQVSDELKDDSEDDGSLLAKDKQSDLPFQAVYLNHGFGASSLSWLPVLPQLVHRLKARVGLGHDAVGFGFTERPSYRTDHSLFSSSSSSPLYYYTPQGSATIGLALLKTVGATDIATRSSSATAPAPVRPPTSDTISASSSPKAVMLVGHSMGSIATLHMALQLPSNVPKLIILAAPALGLRGNPKQNEQQQQQPQQEKSNTAARIALVSRRIISRMIVNPMIVYILKRAVGSPNFWKRGLRMAWGDPERVSDSDALRFAWPSVGVGWEYGLLQFARAQAQPPPIADGELFQRVLQLPNTTVHILVGSKDRVVSPTMVRRFIQSLPTTAAITNDKNNEAVPPPAVAIQELDGLGHDVFEEDVHGFVTIVERLASEFLAKQDKSGQY